MKYIETSERLRRIERALSQLLTAARNEHTAWRGAHRTKHHFEFAHDAEALYAIEGMSQGPLGCNWGDGFGTDAEAVSILQQSGLLYGNPNPFFQKLMVRSCTLIRTLTLTLGRT